MSERNSAVKKAVIYSAVAPDEKQRERFLAYLGSKYGTEIELVWEKSDKFSGGFRLVVDSEVFDWSVSGKYRQLREAMSRAADKKGENIISLLRETIESFSPDVVAEELGTVLTVGDGIATVSGLDKVTYGEIVLFSSGAKGMVLDLRKDEIGCILFDDEGVLAGSAVRRTGKTAGIPVGEAFIGRVINPLGAPIDGKGEIKASGYFPVERPAPGIIERSPVDTPLETGILAIDSMFPIGRGQRELIIGDRQTGKTAIALDTILNQKGKDVICIYVAIGQKASSVAQLAEKLRAYGALDYTVVVNASASESAPIQYIAPYAGCALGEYFMECGKDVLIVYDDLSKHAVAYRALSLLLERSPGREAYPGDVFYLHSRLLERSARLSDEFGGGSITALPIVETQAGDVSAYIPTNIISITDGQIFLESDLFFSGQRPAVNVGLSVSRVGGAAQTKAMKSASGAIRLDLAQYREMEVFTQFSSDLDEATKTQLAYGQGLMRLLRQDQYRHLSQEEQVVLLTATLGKTMLGIPLDKISDYKEGLFDYVKANGAEILNEIRHTRFLSEEAKEKIIALATEFAKGFLKA